jgi:hypothetical protein
MPLVIDEYPPGDVPFTKRERKRKLHLVHCDVRCTDCGWTVSYPWFQTCHGDPHKQLCPACESGKEINYA